MRRGKLGGAWVLAATALFIASGCDDDPIETPVPTSLSIVSGDDQTAEAGEALPQPLVVRVVDQDGDPLAGVTVTWAVATGNGTVSEATTTTNASGQAQVTWTLGPAAGEQSVTATVTGLTAVTFTATATEPPAPAEFTIVSGDEQTGAVDEELAEPLVVLVLDQNGDPMAGITVTWEVVSGDGTVSEATSETDANGEAQVVWTLGPAAGEQSVTATVGGMPVLTFTATATED